MGEPRAAAPTDGWNSQRRLVDFAGAVFFLLLQAAVFQATLLVLPGRSVELTFYGGLALLLVSLGLCIWRLARVRPAAIVALAGLVLQLGFSGLAYLMTS